MAIFARPTGTRPGPTLMDRVLPNPIRNRVRYGFFFLKKTKASPGFIKKSETRPKTWLGYNPITLKLQKNPLYIQLVPHLFNHSSRLPYSASPSQKHTHRSTLKLSFSLSSILIVTTASSLKPSLSQSHPPAWSLPPSSTHSHPPSRPHSHLATPPPCVSMSTPPSMPSQHSSLSDLSLLTVRSWSEISQVCQANVHLFGFIPQIFFLVNFLILTCFLLLGQVVLFLV